MTLLYIHHGGLSIQNLGLALKVRLSVCAVRTVSFCLLSVQLSYMISPITPTCFWALSHVLVSDSIWVFACLSSMQI